MAWFEDSCLQGGSAIVCFLFQWQTLISGAIATLGGAFALWAARIAISAEARSRSAREQAIVAAASVAVSQQAASLRSILVEVFRRLPANPGKTHLAESSFPSGQRQIYLPMIDSEIEHSRDVWLSSWEMINSLGTSKEKVELFGVLADFAKCISVSRICALRARYVVEQRVAPFDDLPNKFNLAIELADKVCESRMDGPAAQRGCI